MIMILVIFYLRFVIIRFYDLGHLFMSLGVEFIIIIFLLIFNCFSSFIGLVYVIVRVSYIDLLIQQTYSNFSILNAQYFPTNSPIY
jgi:hypothetical protein